MANKLVEKNMRTYLAAGHARGLTSEQLARDPGFGAENEEITYTSDANKKGHYLEWEFPITFGLYERSELNDEDLCDPIGRVLPFLAKKSKVSTYHLRIVDGNTTGWLASLEFDENGGSPDSGNYGFPGFNQLVALGDEKEYDPELTRLLIEKMVEIWAEPGFPRRKRKATARAAQG